MKKVLLLLCKGFEVYEAGAFHDVLGWSGAEGGEEIKIIRVGLQKEVVSTFGIKVISDTLLADIQAEEFDALAIPGGFEEYGFYEEAYSEPVADLIRRFDMLGKTIASICVGALPVAYSGILKGRKATTYHLGGGTRRKQLAEFGVRVVDAPMVLDGNVITSTSPATAMDVAFELLGRVTSVENAEIIKRKMGF